MKKQRIVLIVCSVLLILAVVLVVYNQASAAGSKTISMGTGDAGKTITLNKGDTLVVTLDGNPTTGYNWMIQSMEPVILKQVGEPSFTPGSNLAGAPGKFVLTFQAANSGQANLVLNYTRSFEKNTTPLKTFEMTVVVK